MPPTIDTSGVGGSAQLALVNDRRRGRRMLVRIVVEVLSMLVEFFLVEEFLVADGAFARCEGVIQRNHFFGLNGLTLVIDECVQGGVFQQLLSRIVLPSAYLVRIPTLHDRLVARVRRIYVLDQGNTIAAYLQANTAG